MFVPGSKHYIFALSNLKIERGIFLPSLLCSTTTNWSYRVDQGIGASPKWGKAGETGPAQP